MKKKKKWIKLVIILLVIAIAARAIFVWKSHKAKAAAAAATAENTATVEKRSISSQLSSSGTLEAKDTYSITSMVEGEVVSANFEEGDQVEKDQVLYEIDRSSMDTDLNSAQNSVTRSQTSYADALDIITRQHRITAEIHIRQLIQAILRNCISAWEIKSAEIQSWQTSTVMI